MKKVYLVFFSLILFFALNSNNVFAQVASNNVQGHATYSKNYTPKDPNMALLWSVFVPGGGEIYANGSPAVTIISYGAFFGGLISYYSFPKKHYDSVSVLGYTSNYSYKSYQSGYLWAGVLIYTAGWIYGMADAQAAVQRENNKHLITTLIKDIQPTLINAPNGKSYSGIRIALNF